MCRSSAEKFSCVWQCRTTRRARVSPGADVPDVKRRVAGGRRDVAVAVVNASRKIHPGTSTIARPQVGQRSTRRSFRLLFLFRGAFDVATTSSLPSWWRRNAAALGCSRKCNRVTLRYAAPSRRTLLPLLRPMTWRLVVVAPLSVWVCCSGGARLFAGSTSLAYRTVRTGMIDVDTETSRTRAFGLNASATTRAVRTVLSKPGLPCRSICPISPNSFSRCSLPSR